MPSLTACRDSFVWDLDELLNGEMHIVHLLNDKWYGQAGSLRTYLYEQAAKRGIGAKTSQRGLQAWVVAVQAINPHPVGSIEYWAAETKLRRPCTCDSVIPTAHQATCDKITRAHDWAAIARGLAQASEDLLTRQRGLHPEVSVLDPVP